MNAYEYTAITTDKKRIQGLLWADSEDEVSTKLKLEGYVICSIARSSSKSVRWNHKQVSTTAYQLGLLLQSGNSICIVANTRVNDGIINNIVTKKNTFISTSKNRGYEIALTIFCWYFRSRS